MPTYIVGDIHITDTAAYQAHVPRALATIARFGGRVVAGGGRVDVLEGDPMPERIFRTSRGRLDPARKPGRDRTGCGAADPERANLRGLARADPQEKSTGGRRKLGAVSKRGERTIRRLLVIGPSTVVQQASRRGPPFR